jgi:hypothetical protein
MKAMKAKKENVRNESKINVENRWKCINGNENNGVMRHLCESESENRNERNIGEM